MKVANTQQAEVAAYNAIRMKPLTKIVGRPTIRDRNNLVDELCELAVSNDLNFKWAIAADGTNYGALAEVMATAAYTTLTGQTWVNETLPAAFDSGITAATTAYNASKRSAEHEDKRYAFATLVGMRKGLTENIRDALEPQYYQQLKARTIGYKKVTVKQYIKHLDDQWCKLDTMAVVQMKNDYFQPWDQSQQHLTEFSRLLEEEQELLKDAGVTIHDEEKLLHFIQQVAASRVFTKEEYLKWEKKAAADKTWANAKTHFHELVEDNDKYAATAGGTAKAMGYDSAGNVEERDDINEEVRQWVTKIEGRREETEGALKQIADTQGSVVKLTATMAKKIDAKDELIFNLSEELKKVSDTVATLSKKLDANGGRGTGGGGAGGGGAGGGERQGGRSRNTKRDAEGTDKELAKKIQNDDRDLPGWLWEQVNWGKYCHTHGYNPIGKKHTSETCTKPSDGHKKEATKNNRMGGSEEHKPANM
jgi:chromosome condensin MukBEF ATPase and DNA-binding subunit MukB